MHSCVESVIGQYMDPDLLRRGQYLQSVLLQNKNPLSCLEVPSLGGLVSGFGAGAGLVGLFFLTILLSLPVTLWKKSVIDFCLVPPVVAGLGVSAGMAVTSTWVGSASVSPGLGDTFALTKRSLRFLGLLYPHIKCF